MTLFWLGTSRGRTKIASQRVVRQGVVTGNNGAATNKTSRVDGKAGCGAAIGAMDWSGGDTTAACDAVVAMRIEAPAMIRN